MDNPVFDIDDIGLGLGVFFFFLQGWIVALTCSHHWHHGNDVVTVLLMHIIMIIMLMLMLTVMLMMMTTMITPLLLSLLFVIMTLYCPAPHSHYSHHYQPILLFHTFPSYHCRCPVGPTALPTRPSRRGQLWSRTTSFSPIFVRSLSSMVPASRGVLERFSALIIGHSMAFQFSLSVILCGKALILGYSISPHVSPGWPYSFSISCHCYQYQ